MIDKDINVKKIDLSGVSFPTNDASTCALIYTAVRNTYGFPLYLTNFKINDEKRNAILVNPIILDNQTIINLNDCHLIVTPTEISVGNGVYGASLESIVDKDGNPRFAEFDGVTSSIEGVTITYNKASLSGTHLMLVIAGSIANGTNIDNRYPLALYSLPAYIMNKIIPVWSINIEIKTFAVIAEDWSFQSIQCRLAKESSTQLCIYKTGDLTLTADRNFRIQFDLLIDAE